MAEPGAPRPPRGGFTRNVLHGGPTATVRTLGAVRQGVDFYYRLARAPWWALIAGFVAAFLLFNLLFAALYSLQPGSLGTSEPAPADIPPFWRAFFFSVDTLLTIGYGSVYPHTLWANILVTIQSLCGLLLFAITTGLVFARFARPTSRILFSDVAVVAPTADGPALLFRAVNRRHNLILDARVTAVLLRTEPLPGGRSIRRFRDLHLQREQNPLFALSWTAAHVIDESSPLHGVGPEAMRANGDEIVVLLTGVDEVLGSPIHARHGYPAERVLWNRRFADILSADADGRPVLDYGAFHRTLPADAPPA